MSKEIAKKSKSKFMLRLIAVAALAGAVWQIAVRVIAGNDNNWED